MNNNIDEEFKGIKDIYVLQCVCSELKNKIEYLEYCLNLLVYCNKKQNKEIKKLKKELYKNEKYIN